MLSKKQVAIASSIYLIYVMVLTMNPFEFSWTAFTRYFQQGISNIFYLLFLMKWTDILGNILLFLPAGYITANLSLLKGQSHFNALRSCLFIGFSLSFMVEFLQFFSNRSTSVIDLLANTTGALLGGYLTVKIRMKHGFGSGHARPVRRFYRGVGLILYITLYWGLLYSVVRFNHTRNWSDDFHLYLGNEATGDRPWQGEIVLAAVYGKALNPQRIRALWDAGPLHDTGLRRELNPLVLYDFKDVEGRDIQDLSAVQPPLILEADSFISEPSRASLPLRGQRIQSRVPAWKINTYIRESNAITIELWFGTNQIDQTGPARILTISESPDARNVMIGQNQQKLHFRVRSPLTGPNGSKVSLTTPDLISGDGIHHVAATFHSGVEQLYFDGRRVRGTIYGHIDYLSRIIGFGKNFMAKVMVVWGLLFPLGYFIARHSPGKSWMTGSIVAFLVAWLADLYFQTSLGQPVGWLFLGISFMAAVTGGLSGAGLRRMA